MVPFWSTYMYSKSNKKLWQKNFYLILKAHSFTYLVLQDILLNLWIMYLKNPCFAKINVQLSLYWAIPDVSWIWTQNFCVSFNYWLGYRGRKSLEQSNYQIDSWLRAPVCWFHFISVEQILWITGIGYGLQLFFLVHF